MCWRTLLPWCSQWEGVGGEEGEKPQKKTGDWRGRVDACVYAMDRSLWACYVAYIKDRGSWLSDTKGQAKECVCV